MSANKEFAMVPGGALGTTTTGETIYVGDYTNIDMYMSATAVSGTSPTLDCVVSSSADGSVWITHTTFTQVTAAAAEKKNLTAFGNYIRVISTIGGSSTPIVTFTLKSVGK